MLMEIRFYLYASCNCKNTNNSCKRILTEGKMSYCNGMNITASWPEEAKVGNALDLPKFQNNKNYSWLTVSCWFPHKQQPVSFSKHSICSLCNTSWFWECMTVLMETELFLPPSERYRVIRETTVTNWVQLSLGVTTGTNPDLSYEHKPLFHTYSQKKRVLMMTWVF